MSPEDLVRTLYAAKSVVSLLESEADAIYEGLAAILLRR
jgi:hypothetical protein